MRRMAGLTIWSKNKVLYTVNHIVIKQNALQISRLKLEHGNTQQRSEIYTALSDQESGIKSVKLIYERAVLWSCWCSYRSTI